jgi:hypothetical protein
MLHVFIGEILANMTQVSDVVPGPLVLICNFPVNNNCLIYNNLLVNNNLPVNYNLPVNNNVVLTTYRLFSQYSPWSVLLYQTNSEWMMNRTESEQWTHAERNVNNRKNGKVERFRKRENIMEVYTGIST